MIRTIFAVIENTAASPSCWVEEKVGEYPTLEAALSAADICYEELAEEAIEYNNQLGPESNSYYRQYGVEIRQIKRVFLGYKKTRQRKLVLIPAPNRFKRKPRN